MLPAPKNNFRSNSFRSPTEMEKRPSTGMNRVSSLVRATNNNTYDIGAIKDEKQLNDMLSESTDFELRQKIRARLRELRDERRKELEDKRKEEKATEMQCKSKDADTSDAPKAAPQSSDSSDSRRPQVPVIKVAVCPEPVGELEAQLKRASQPGTSGSLSVTSRVWGNDVNAQVTTTKTWGSSPAPTSNDKPKPMGAIAALAAEGIKRNGSSSQNFRPRVQKRAEDSDSDSEVKYRDSPSAGGVSRSRTFHAAARPQTWQPQKPVASSGSFRESGGPGNARAMFEQKDKATNPSGARPNFLATMSSVKRAANKMRSAVEIKNNLLNWVKLQIAEYENIEITNFSTAWNDGMAFCALIHHFYPKEFDYNKLEKANRQENFELAFDTAERCGDIAPLLDVEDMVRMKKPDWKCVFTYVQSLYRHLRKHPRAVGHSEE